MKSLKITLTILVVTAIGAGFFFWLQSIKEPGKIIAPENQFTALIEQEIEQIKAKPDNKFCKAFYDKIVFDINTFYEQNRFDNDQLKNDQWKRIFEVMLYSVYTEKFIQQAKFIFQNSEWKDNDLKFIRAEIKKLKKSKLFVAGSLVDKDFSSLRKALKKYYEIANFNRTCWNLPFSKKGLLTDNFPITKVQSKITRAKSLLSNGLENEFVNNCTHLHNQLKAIPQALFNKHVWYLYNKIKKQSRQFEHYKSHKEYSNLLFQPLRAEIIALKKEKKIYSVSNFDNELNKLIDKWKNDNLRAYDYFEKENSFNNNNP